MSPRMFRPPPGMRGPPPPWAARGFRPPFDPRFSPRGLPRRHMGPRPPPRHRPPGPPRGPPGMMRHPRPPFGGPRYPPGPPPGAGPASFPYSAPQSPMTSYRPSTGGAFTPITDSPSPPASLPASRFSERPDPPDENEVISTPEFPTLAASALPGSKQNEVSSSLGGRGGQNPEELEDEEEVPSPPPRAKAKPLPEKE